MTIKVNVGPLPRLLLLVVVTVGLVTTTLTSYGYSKSFAIPAALFLCLQLQKFGLI
jgi:hypothetical protein